MKRTIYFLAGLVVLSLAACSGSGDAHSQASSQPGLSDSAAIDGSAQTVAISDNAGTEGQVAAPANETSTLSDAYSGALSIRAQLALGTIQLDETDEAVTVEQAETLIPLWQLLSTLENSGTAAQAELDAVVGQIEDAMTPEQISAIAALQLNEASLDDFSLSGFGQQGEGEEAGGGFAGGPGFGPGGGGPPGEGFGGGPGGGAGPGGGPGFGPGGGLGGGEFDADAIATRQAELANASPAELAEQFSVNLVLRLLQTKTGELPAGQFGPNTGLMAATLAEFGLTEEQIGTGLEAGQSFAEIATEHGIDLDTVRQALIEDIEEAGELQGADAEAAAERLLEGGFGRGQNQQQP